MPIFLLVLASLLQAQDASLTFAALDGQPTLVEAVQGARAERELLRAPATLKLGPGHWTIRLSRGPHFRRVERELDLRAGETLDFGAATFDRMIDLRPQGWFAGGIGEEMPGLDLTAPLDTARQGRLGGLGRSAAAPANLDRLASFDALALLRHAGAATFATSEHAGLPFDLAAAGLVDALVLTTGERARALWSLLLDHGYAPAAMAGPGARLYVQCPAGPAPPCVAEAIRHQRTVVSTGPALTVKDPGSHQLEIDAWARQDLPDRLLRIELWAHNRVIATRAIAPGEEQHFAGSLAWTPAGPDDWVAVRAISQSGWALSSALFTPERKPTPALLTHVKMVFPEIASQQQAGALASIWPIPPGLPGAKPTQEIEMERNELEVDAPVTSLVRIELSDGRQIDTRLEAASGVRAYLADLAARPEALLEWTTYDEVLRRCRRVSIESRF